MAATDEYVTRISDPAVRILVQGVIAQRNKLKAKLDTLKAATKVVVDRLPEGAIAQMQDLHAPMD